MRPRARLTIAAATASCLVVPLVSPAVADDVETTLGKDGSTSIAAGSSTGIAYRLDVATQGGDKVAGCNATALSPVRVAFTAPSAVKITAGASGPAIAHIDFINCTTTQTVNFSSSTQGSHNVTHDVTGGLSTSVNRNRADFTLNVTAPVDSTPPVITKTITGTAGTNGWHTSNVSVAWTVTDNESTATLTGCGTQSFTTETAAATSSCSATSAGGTASDSVTVKIDKTAPTGVALSPSGTTGTDSWFTSSVAVTTNGTDALSGVSCTPVQNLTTETTGTAVNGSCTNGAGLTAAAPATTVKIDKTAPTNVALTPSGTEGANGWYTSNVSVATSGTDAISGATCSAPTDLTTETAGTAVNGSCTNGAGLSSLATAVTVKIDKSNPTAALSIAAGSLGGNGWYTDDVTVATSGSDDMSSDVTCTEDQYQRTDTSSAGRTFNGSCTNGAGLTEPAQALNVKRDASAPTATLTVTEGTHGANGWYTSDVTVTLRGADAQSGVTCEGGAVLDDETTGTRVTGYCINGAGIRTDATPVTIKIDKSGPSAGLAVTAGGKGRNGWYTSNVTVGTSGSDTVSGGVNCTADQSQTTETAGHEFNGSCTNAAGLTTSAHPLTVKLDKTGPTAASSVTAGEPGTNGWYTSDVTVSTTGTDALSGASCTPLRTQEDETTGTNLAGNCTNGAGLETSAAPLYVKLDKSAPSASISATGTSGANGWYTSAVSLTTTGEDAVSGGVSCSADQSQATETSGATYYGSCTNAAGLTSVNARLTVKVDLTAPAGVAVNGFPDGANYTLSETLPTPTCATPSDTISTVASSSGPTIKDGRVSNVGPVSYTCTATNGAGMVGSDTKTFNVVPYTWGGFKAPIDARPTFNRTKAGSAIPVKFSLTGNQGLDIWKNGQAPSVGTVTCGTSLDDVEATVTAGSSSLSYDVTSDTYNYVWKTQTSFAGACRTLVLNFKDGSQQIVNFTFTK